MSLDEKLWNAARAALRARQGELPLARLAPGERSPAAFAQEGLWLLDRMRPGDDAYNLAVAFRLRGRLDLRALEQSLLGVVERHEILRTTLALDEGELLQRVGPVPATILRKEPLPSADVATWASARAREPFDLCRGPLFRAALAEISDDDHCLLLANHHATLDAWSFEILMRELCTLYQLHANGQPVPGAPPAWQYRDFAAWERRQMASGRCDGLIAYWRAELPSETPALALPTDRARKTGLAGRGACQTCVYDRALATALKSLAEEAQTTLFTVLHAAFNVLLHRYSGDTDIVVGCPVAIRSRPELADMLGMLINTLPLRTRLGESSRFRDLLEQVKHTVSGALAHQDLPFELLVRALGRHHYASSPLFRVMFAFQNVPRSRWRFAGLECEAWNVEPEHAKFDLTVTMQERDDGLAALFAFDASLFDTGTIARMLDHFGNLLAAMVAEPNRPIGKLALLSPAERTPLLALGRGPTVSCPRSIHRLFEEQAQRSPEATAILSAEDRRLSYHEVNQRANQLARVLTSGGVGRGSLVGICVRRSPSLIVGQLAILKAGAAYVPIADLPAARVKRVVESLAVVVTDASSRSRFSAFAVATVDLDRPSLASQPVGNLDGDGTPDDLAYVMFTSGSTGEPRAVAVPHRGVVRLVAGDCYARFAADEVFLQLAPVAFDASTFEVWGALLVGATLALAPSGLSSPAEIGALVSRHQVSTLWLTAGLFELVVDAELSSLGSLRQLLTGGDVVSVGHARRFRERWPRCRLFNCYGPTENTTFSTAYEVGHVGDERSIPIGRPIANTTLHLLDSNMEPVPRGVVGEAYLGGDGVARGYLDDEAATGARFVASPFVAGETLYRTGDRMRLRRDGELEFLGRCDAQMKVRGFRIEPGEVEQALASCAGVRSAVVRAEGDTASNKRLHAYVVTDDEDPELPAKLRAALRARLPTYMVPATITRVASLAITEHGKRTFPAVEPRPSALVDAAAPRTPAEQTVARTFAKVLERDSFGIDESFFDLGGDSLGAIRVLAILGRETLRDLPLSMLYENPSVAELAHAMTVFSGAVVPGDSSVVTLKAGRNGRPLFLIAGGRGGKPELAICAKLVSGLGPQETVCGLLAPPDARPVQEAAKLHVATIKRLQPQGPYRLGGECIGGVVAYDMAQQLVACGETVELLLLLDCFCPTDAGELARDPRLRRLSPRKMLDKLLDLARAGMSFVAELPGRDPKAVPWPVELWRRLSVSEEVRCHIRACKAYRPEPYSGKVVVVASEESLRLGLAEPWRSLARGGMVVRPAPGDHDSYSRRYFRETSEILRRCLQEEEEEGGARGD